MKKTITLPIELDYESFVSNNKEMKNIEGVYRISFIDGSFYIGRTSNFIGRIYNHATIYDLKNGCVMTKKQERMFKAIRNAEEVIFELISYNQEDEKSVIESHIKTNLCLNMKR